jgi:hypothetical protein
MGVWPRQALFTLPDGGQTAEAAWLVAVLVATVLV